MAEYSRFFGGPAEAIPEYVQPQFAEVLAKLFSNGVFKNVGNELEVTEHDPVALAVDVDTGEGWINGFWYQNTGEGTPPVLTKSLAAADPVNPRIDRIVLRLDTVTNFKISCEVLEGTPAAEPTPPELTQTAAIYEISLAQVYVGANVTSISDANITDEREFAGVPEAANAGTLDDYDLVPDIAGGWFPAGETWTYASADDPTFTFTISGDLTSKYSAGMKIKLTQTTVKYFIITKVAYSSPNTTVTIYGGTDYDLADAAITLPYYSTMKAPFGFPLDPDKWTVEVTDTTIRSQSDPVQNTWYNLGAVSIDVPIGNWNLGYYVTARAFKTGATASVTVTLSKVNNTEDDKKYSARGIGDVYSALAISRFNIADLAAKTTYFINTRTTTTGIQDIENSNDVSTLIIKAICAYL